MDINEIDQPENEFEETYAKHSDSPDSSDIFGESELLPRVGDEYQAAIPDMLTPSELLKYFSSRYNSQPMINVSHDFLIGNKEETAIIDEAIRVHDDVDSSRTDSKQCVAYCSASDKKESNVKGDFSDHRRVNNGYCAVPGLPTDSWSEFEVDSFLLGLYIFGKNLLQVKRFMESKEMGQLLSFYYGRFFRSDKYRRWADCRKTKGRKCIIGQRLLIGSKQQELFSRLFPRLSEESKNTSVEAYRAFADGRTSVEEYVSTLKNMVGIQALVEAVAIGKVNKDLTIMAMEPSRARPEMPSGKDYSSLTYEEIIKYLTGDLRLSKARSSDLFWDAVWPRLLAKGWHSEKPKDEAFRSSKNCLVFLFPGINKYRRKLLKGDHYFDSVSDVLKKVASEPEVLLLENEEIGARSSGEENGLEPKSDGDGEFDHDHNRDLKLHFSSKAEAYHMKFTVVDTGLFHEDEPSKVIEQRSLPTKTKKSSAGVRRSSVAEVSVSADGVGESAKAIDLSEKQRDRSVYNHPKGQPSSGGKKRMANISYDPPQKPVKNHSDNLCADKQVCPVKHNAEHRLAYAQQECVDPAVKRRKLIASSKAETKPRVGDFAKSSFVRQNNCVLSLSVPSKKPIQRIPFHVHIGNGVSPTGSLVADNHEEKSHKGNPNQGSCSSAISSESYARSDRLMIDLNVPQAPDEADVNDMVIIVKVEESNDSSQNGSHDSSETVGGSTIDGICSDEQANGNARRQSTRIRPMSTRALEALESNLFNPKASKRRSSADSQDEKPRASRRARAKTSMPGNCTVDAVRDSETMRPNGILQCSE